MVDGLLKLLMPRVLDHQPDVVLSGKIYAGHDIFRVSGVDGGHHEVAQQADVAC